MDHEILNTEIEQLIDTFLLTKEENKQITLLEQLDEYANSHFKIVGLLLIARQSINEEGVQNRARLLYSRRALF